MTDKENIYQLIWNDDQEGNGVRPVLSRDDLTDLERDIEDKENGYIVVSWPDEKDTSTDHRILAEAKIPDKDQTYDKCKALFDNYELDKNDREIETSQEKEEIKDFIDSIKDKPPMKRARSYLDPKLSDEDWFDLIKEVWFTPFGDNDRSGFEHVFVGENSGSNRNIGGYHFWYKYFLDDGNGKVDGKDSINFDRRRGEKALEKVPEIVTLKFNWNPEGNEKGDLEKPIGGFWIGCSPEGLVALGMARWKEKTEGRTKAVINKTLYEITLYTDIDRRKTENRGRTDDKHINTFWPKFLEGEDEPAGGSDNNGGSEGDSLPIPATKLVRIVRALINPEGDDVGKETVTLVNVTSSPVDINGWTIEDRNGKTEKLDGSLNAEEEKTLTLSGDGAQLSNRGEGKIILKNSNKEVVDERSYRLTKGDDEVTFIL